MNRMGRREEKQFGESEMLWPSKKVTSNNPNDKKFDPKVHSLLEEL
jgi:hypothetical protein